MTSFLPPLSTDRMADEPFPISKLHGVVDERLCRGQVIDPQPSLAPQKSLD